MYLVQYVKQHNDNYEISKREQGNEKLNAPFILKQWFQLLLLVISCFFVQKFKCLGLICKLLMKAIVTETY